jgi:hypothetical protein
MDSDHGQGYDNAKTSLRYVIYNDIVAPRFMSIPRYNIHDHNDCGI